MWGADLYLAILSSFFSERFNVRAMDELVTKCKWARSLETTDVNISDLANDNLPCNFKRILPSLYHLNNTRKAPKNPSIYYYYEGLLASIG